MSGKVSLHRDRGDKMVVQSDNTRLGDSGTGFEGSVDFSETTNRIERSENDPTGRLPRATGLPRPTSAV